MNWSYILTKNGEYPYNSKKRQTMFVLQQNSKEGIVILETTKNFLVILFKSKEKQWSLLIIMKCLALNMVTLQVIPRNSTYLSTSIFNKHFLACPVNIVTPVI